MRICGTALVGALLIALPVCGAAQGDRPGELAMDVRDFVRAVYVEGVPYDAATRYTSEDSAVLLEMLGDHANALYWPNITMVLGVIGDDAVVEPLIDFVHGRNGGTEWSTSVYRGRVSAVGALGYLVNKNESPAARAALEYLLDSVDPATWDDREIPWLAGRKDAGRIREQLSVTAILGLAITGRDEAADRLNELLDDERTPTRLRSVTESVRPALDEIRAHGLSAYYQGGKRLAIASASR